MTLLQSPDLPGQLEQLSYHLHFCLGHLLPFYQVVELHDLPPDPLVLAELLAHQEAAGAGAGEPEHLLIPAMASCSHPYVVARQASLYSLLRPVASSR